MKNQVRIAIFASGGGSNAEQLLAHFKDNLNIEVKLIVSNISDAGVLDRAKNHNVSTFVHTKEDAQDGGLLQKLVNEQIDLIVLAGYLKKIGDDLIYAFPNKIINIHPALLPKFGGKGMYGMNVHKAVVEAQEKESGPTIHYVNENYDEGAIIEQHKCKIESSDSPEDVQRKVLALEHKFFAPCIENVIKNGI